MVSISQNKLYVKSYYFICSDRFLIRFVYSAVELLFAFLKIIKNVINNGFHRQNFKV